MGRLWGNFAEAKPSYLPSYFYLTLNLNATRTLAIGTGLAIVKKCSIQENDRFIYPLVLHTSLIFETLADKNCTTYSV